MNSFTLVAIGTLARNPEVTAKGDVAYVRFCLTGQDHAESDDEVTYARKVFNTVWFMAFGDIADRIARHARKGDQLVVTARVRTHACTDKVEGKRCVSAFIVTDLRFGAKGGPSSTDDSLSVPRPLNPVVGMAVAG